MEDRAPTPSRRPPEHVNRTTRRGADQYVLACNARRDAGDLTFQSIELLEEENRRLRDDVKWKLEHASARSGRWVRGKIVVLMTILAGVAALDGWWHGRGSWALRVGYVQGYAASHNESPATVFKRKHDILSVMTQHEIDSVVAAVAAARTHTAK